MIMKTVVVIGGSYGGLVACKTLINTIKTDFELVVIATSSHAFYNVAAPRVLIEPEKFDRLLYPIQKKFKSRKHAKCKFILGKVTDLDCDNQKVKYENEGTEAQLDYDYVIIASGTSGDTAAFQINGAIQESIDSHKVLVKQIEESHEIAVIGGGPTGVEVVGEIGDHYRTNKKVTLYHSKEYPLHTFGPEMGKRITAKMNEVNINVVNGVTLEDVKEVDGKQEMHFSDGSTAQADLVIRTGQKPNSQFLPAKHLDKKGFIVTTKNLTLEGHENVMVIGDVLANSGRNLFDMWYGQLPVIKANMKKLIDGAGELGVYSSGKQHVVIPIGKSGGAGIYGSWNLPSWLVYFIKGKNYGMAFPGRFFST